MSINRVKLYHIVHTLRKFYPWILKSIYFNFHYLPFKQAIKLPILLRKPRFIKLKGKVIIDCPKVEFGMITLGRFVNTCNPSNGTIFDIDGTLIFRGWADFANNSAIMIQSGGTITLGNHMDCAGQLKCAKSIEFGNDCVLAYNSMVMDSDWHALTDVVTGKLVKKMAPIKIGNNNFISFNCLVTKGTITPDYCTFTYNSHLCKKYDVEPYSLLGGNPCVLLDEGYYYDRNNN
jgi:acetyltransferase-like isoleucine patch superfamily enzyme